MQLQIEGMSCQHCQRAVQEALGSVPGVVSVDVNLENGSANVEGDADLRALRAALEEAGYSLRDG